MRGPSIQLYAPHTYMQDRREYNAWKSELKTADFGMVSTKGSECVHYMHGAHDNHMTCIFDTHDVIL